jgi:hypothetical protein
VTEQERQEAYQEADWLHDTAWRWVLWHPPHPGWDHDHCVFCHAHICDNAEHPGVLRECWRYGDPEISGDYESVCASCFEELHKIFRWTVLTS